MKSIKKDERGIASIIVVTIIILILTLIVLAMARNANREQRQALDRQLSNQAFYAAESGINDTVEYIRKNLSTAPKEKKQCDTSGDNRFSGFPDGNLDGNNVIRYSCVLYDQNPTTLQYNLDSNSTIIPVQNADGNGVSALTFEWQNSQGSTNFAGCPSSTQTDIPGDWFGGCDFGMIRLEIIDPNRLNRTSLIDNNSTFFIFPVVSGGSTIFLSNGKGDKQGSFGYANCSSAGGTSKCSISLDAIGLNGNSKIFIRARSIYHPSTLTITGKNNVASRGGVKFLNAQVMVDATGKANDVLRRLQVRVPVRPQYDYPNFAIEATDGICKKIDIYPGQTSPADTCSY